VIVPKVIEYFERNCGNSLGRVIAGDDDRLPQLGDRVALPFGEGSVTEIERTVRWGIEGHIKVTIRLDGEGVRAALLRRQAEMADLMAFDMLPPGLDVAPLSATLTADPNTMSKRVPKTHKARFAQEFKSWRSRKGFSQSQAAEFLEISVKTLQNWEIARTMPHGIAMSAVRALMELP
jgi:DNA-binding transcriptional regulator YiaG